MKRAIYVGKLHGPSGFFGYGMTGEATPFDACDPSFVWFRFDGGLGHWMVHRSEIYIPSEDQQRHCPKP